MRARVLSTFALCFLLSAVAAGHAQVPASPPSPSAPPPGFVPAYEITRTVRKAGFDPLAPPLREGTTYVLRATDYRGILMRVVVDARTGAIRDVNRIVPGPGAYAPYEPYGPAPYGRIGMVPYGEQQDGVLPPYGPVTEFDALPPAESGLPHGSPHASVLHPSRASVIVLPPLPRPRPAELAARNPAEDVRKSVEHAKTDAVPSTAADAVEIKTGAAPDAQPASKPAGAAPGAPAAAAAASVPPASASPAPPTTASVKAKVPPPPPIND